ncbi:MAG: hypothetical protein AB8C84_02685 [Oligoflexales bacterium]
MMENETTTRIADKQRIRRILQRLSHEAIPLFVRTQSSSPVAVKAKSGHLQMKGERVEGFHIHGISQKGVNHLSRCSKVYVEFMMLSTKIMTVVPLLKSFEAEGRIYIGMPDVLLSVQRRENERFKTSGTLQPYLKLSKNRSGLDERRKMSADDEELSFFPVWAPYQELQELFIVKDLSLGGFSMQTVFPGQVRNLEPGMLDYDAQLLLSSLGRVQVGVELKWSKRLRQTEKFRGKESSYFTHQFGFFFLKEQSQNGFQEILHQYIRQLSRLEGI